MFCPNHLHEEALNKIGRYLKLAQECGLILNINRYLFNIDSYPDAYFSGMYEHEKPTDPACVKSRNGCVITFSECTFLWKSKLQTETSILTMEA